MAMITAVTPEELEAATPTFEQTSESDVAIYGTAVREAPAFWKMIIEQRKASLYAAVHTRGLADLDDTLGGVIMMCLATGIKMGIEIQKARQAALDKLGE